MNHQDFKPVVLRKNSPIQSVKNNQSQKSPKKEEDGQVVAPKLFTKDFGQKLTNARTKVNMNRKDLSLKLNVKESVIADIENAKLLYDGNLVHKIKKIFPNL
jgi:ribosome-binding protein aMBF1 (putative translation factor)